MFWNRSQLTKNHSLDRSLFAIGALKVCPDNTYLIYKGKYHCMADLLIYWFGFDQNKLIFCSFNESKAVESKQIKMYGDTSPY